MIAIIESGATKGDWRILDDEGRQIRRCLFPGTNVSSMRLEDVEDMKVNIENTVAELKTNIDGLTEKADVLLTDLQAQVDGLENIERRLNPLNW